MSLLISDFYSAFKWLYLGGSEEPPVEPPVIGDVREEYELPPLNAKRARKYAYNISSICRHVDKLQPNHELGFGLRRYAVRIIDLAILILKDSSIKYKKKGDYQRQSKLERISNILLNERKYRVHLRTARKYYMNYYDIKDDWRINLHQWYLKKTEESKIAAVNLLINTLEKHLQEQNSQPLDIVFSGAWTGHAVMYGIHKDEKSDMYTFSIWNTGNGMLKHNSHSGKYEIRANWSRLTYDQVSDRQFLETLFELTYLRGTSAEQAYTLISEYFGQPMDPLSEMSHLSEGQKDGYGNCVWKCFWASLADLLGRDQDPALVLEVKANIIRALYIEILEKIPPEKAKEIDPILIRSAKIMEDRIWLKWLSQKIKTLNTDFYLGFKRYLMGNEGL